MEGRKRSPVWKHFTEIENDEGTNRLRVKCDHCYRTLSISNGCIGNMSRHLRNKHPAIMFMLNMNQNTRIIKTDGDDENGTEENDDNDNYEKVFVMSRNNANSEESGEEIEYLEEVVPPKKKSPKPKPIKRKNNFQYDNHYEPARKQNYYKEDDRSHIFGKLVTVKMSSLDNNQRIYAEKIINDALHEAQLGNLNKYCCLSSVQLVQESTVPESVDINDDKNVSTNSS